MKFAMFPDSLVGEPRRDLRHGERPVILGTHGSTPTTPTLWTIPSLSLWTTPATSLGSLMRHP